MEKRTLAIGSVIAISALMCVGAATLLGQDYARYASDEWALERVGAIPDNPIAETPQPSPSELAGPVARATAGPAPDEADSHHVHIDGIDQAHDLTDLVGAEEYDGRTVTVHGLEIMAPAEPTAEPRAFWARPANAPDHTASSKVLLVMPPEATAANPIDPRYDIEAGNTVDVVGSLARLDHIAPTVTGHSGTMGLAVRTIHTL